MRISDWSSDVCSSDLTVHRVATAGLRAGNQIFVKQPGGRFLHCSISRLSPLRRAGKTIRFIPPAKFLASCPELANKSHKDLDPNRRGACQTSPQTAFQSITKSMATRRAHRCCYAGGRERGRNGRTSGRGRGWQYGMVTEVAVPL